MALAEKEMVRLKHYAGEIDFNVLKETFSKIQISNNFAMDIGGSLIKIVYQTTKKIKRKIPISQEISYDYVDSEAQQSCLCFTRFETQHLTECLNFVLENIVSQHSKTEIEPSDKHHLKITGGGAVKFKEMISQKLNIVVDKVDEMESLIRGCCFLLKNIPDEVFYFDDISETSSPHFSSSCLINPFPFLLVNIGSGVSILKVENENTFRRVGGTSIGGGTFWGIGSLISGGESFDQLLQMAGMGDYRNVDMLVKHIYGGAYEALGLDEDIIASSFGRAQFAFNANSSETNSQQLPKYSKEDVINSLLVSISYNIAQLACLHADICKVQKIIFGGFFTRGHIMTMKMIGSSVKYWSKNNIKAMFLRHEGYLGAIGAFLQSTNLHQTSSFDLSDNAGVICSGGLAGNIDSATFSEVIGECGGSTTQLFGNNQQNIISNKTIEVHNMMNSSWLENYAGSATFHAFNDDSFLDDEKIRCYRQSSNDSQKLKFTCAMSKSLENLSINAKTLVGFETRELECIVDKLEVFKLLYSPQNYQPDSWDLTSDNEARKYWLNCFKDNVPQETTYQSQKEYSETAKTRSELYAKDYLKYLEELETEPTMHGILTVRCLLDAHQNFLRKYGFTDPFWMQKKKENEMALKMFPMRIKQLARLDFLTRQYELVIGFLAGNVFDWGSKEVVALMDKSQNGVIDFSVAINKLQTRPWLTDGYVAWIDKMLSRPSHESPYQSILIFCDNSGFDFIIGVMPFVIEMLSRGALVILSANSEPAINDVTFSELVILTKTLSFHSKQLELSLKNKKLLMVPNGQMSPCLDLRFVSKNLNYIVESSKVDLVVIEGMARAIHTNLNVQFSCDSLKIAVIKNAWLANRLGGALFSVVFKYEQFSQFAHKLLSSQFNSSTNN